MKGGRIYDERWKDLFFIGLLIKISNIAMFKDKNQDSMELFLQKQPRNLTMAKHNLGIHQMRIMTRIVQKLQPHMGFEVDYTQEAKDIWVKVRVADLVVEGNVKPLRIALDGLMQKIVRILHYLPEKAAYLEIGMPIIQEYEYEHGSSEIKLKIGGRLFPQIIDLARGYTKYSLEVAFKTSSPKVFKIYQYIASFRDKKQIQCNVDTLRQWLQIEDKYKVKEIKQHILNPAMKELKEKADVWFDITRRVMDGRKMKGWKFNIYTKKTALETPPRTQPIPVLNPLIENSLRRLVSEFGIAPEQAQKFAPHAQRPDFNALLDAVKNLKSVKNLAAYTYKVLDTTFLQKTPTRPTTPLLLQTEQDLAYKKEQQEKEQKQKEKAYNESLEKELGITQTQITKLSKWAKSKKGSPLRLVQELDHAKKKGGDTAKFLQERLKIEL